MSLNLRFGFLTIVLLAAAVLTVSYLFDRERLAALESVERKDLKIYADRAANELAHYTARLSSDTLFLSNLPSLKGLNETNQKTQQITQTFLALGHARPEYFQLRLLASDASGQELVRIERQDGELIEVASADLQAKGNRYYAKGFMQLQEGQVRLSRIDLNREHNRISLPETSTLRAVAPVMDAEQRTIALVVINMDMGQVFKQMIRYLPVTGCMYLINEKGYFLYHPDSLKAMTFDRSQPYLVADEFPRHARGIRRLGRGAGLAFQIGSGDRAALAYATKRPLTTPSGDSQTLTLIVSVAKTGSYLELAQARQNSYLIIALLLIGAFLLALTMGNRLTRSLRRLGEVSHAVMRGQFDVEIPAAPPGELANLSNAFRLMIRTLQSREEQLQRINLDLGAKVKERTRELEESKTTLAREQLLLQSILDHVGDGVVAVDNQGRFLLWNQRAEELVGTGAVNIPPEEWPSYFGLYRSPDGSLLSLEELPLPRALRGETVRNQDLYIRNKHRLKGHWVSVFARPLGNPSEDTYGAVAVLVDIEENKRLKELRERQADELEKIARLTLIAQIVESVTHRLSQPLAAIANYTGAALLMRSSDSLDSQRLEDILEHIARLAERGGQILDEFRKLAQKSDLQQEKLRINDIVHTAQQLISDRLTRLNIHVEQRLLPDLPPVMGRKIELQEVLIHLIINSLESLSSIEDQPRRLYLRTNCTADRKHLEIAVGDNGPGIEPLMAEQIFEPWYTTKPGSLGLGLTLACNVAENHNGTISLQRGDDQLTWFVIDLPAYHG